MSPVVRRWLLVCLAVAGTVFAAHGWAGDQIRARAFCEAYGGVGEMKSDEDRVQVFCEDGSGVSWRAE